ncbi:MAG: hypothetical protein V3T77_08875 [Planctomycetota bacterium]
MSCFRNSSWLCLWLVLPLTAFPQEKPTKKPEELIRATLEALGGSDGYRKSANAKYVYVAKSDSGATPFSSEMSLTLYTRDDGRRRLEKRVAGQRQRYGYDGENYWMTLAGDLVRKLPDGAADGMKLDSIQQLIFLDYKSHGYVASSAAPVTEKNRTLDRVTFLRKKLSPAQMLPGDQLHYYFDAKTHLPYRLEFLCPDPWGRGSVSIILLYEDYRSVDGVLIPHRVRQIRDSSDTVVLEIQEVSIGEHFPDSLFKRPR